MIRKVFLLLSVAILGYGVSDAQDVQLPCTTTEVNESLKQSFPEIATYEQQLRDFIAEGMKNMNTDRARGKGTFGPDDVLHIPVVVHVIHDYGTTDYVSDDEVHQLIKQINDVYMKRNSDTTQVISPFKSYIGNPNITFHLATKDPNGKPTNGITHRRSYLTNGGDDQAKFDQWDPSSYLNIWTIQRIGRGISNGVVAAYAVFPSSASAFPYSDGIISSAGSILSNKTIPHEIGHILNLYHTWGNIQVAKDCTGDDEVDDTPPTTGHFSNGSPFGNTANGNCDAASLYDTTCTNNITSLAKILLDKTASPKLDSAEKGFDYIPRTNMTLESINIYPGRVGDEFVIKNFKQDRNTGSFNEVNSISTKKDTIGLSGLSAPFTSNNYGVDSPAIRNSIAFNTLKHLWVDSVTIYPTTVGDSFIVNVLKFNGDTVKTYRGVTTTNSGPQVVPVSVFLAPATGYKMQISRNPGLKADVISRTEFGDMISGTNQGVRNIVGVMSLESFVDSTNADVNNKGNYAFFYDWRIRFDALTTTDSGAQTVALGFKVIPDTTYRLTLTTNPGVYSDVVGTAPYVRSIPCIIDIKNDTTNGRYDLLYNLRIRYGYIKNCIDYPDTVNTQNIMDYANCPIMFTKLQVARMRLALASKAGNRNMLVNDTTHVRTGILNQFGGTYGIRYDMKPIPDFSVERLGIGERTYFVCADDINFQFKDRSWNDTIQAVEYTFNKGAQLPTITRNTTNLNTTFTNRFSEPGWVDVTVKATGNNSGDSTITFKNAVYAADGKNPINPMNGFMMDFEASDANNPFDKWPIFNYYDNDFKWQVMDNVGHTGNGCISYRGYDKRLLQVDKRYVGTPKGDYDDFFTPAFDLTGMTGTECRLNFMSSGAFRVSDSRLMRDTLQISYSTDCGQNWVTLANVGKSELANKGIVPIEYAPLYYGDWDLRSFDIPLAARQGKVFFRFRFRPGADDINQASSTTIPGTGNNYYIDRLNISPFKLGLNTLLTGERSIALAPNPTTGASNLVIKSTSHDLAHVQVTDVTGKVVYTTEVKLNGDMTSVEIPASAIRVKGVYMVHVAAGTDRFTEKLVSY